MTPSPRALAAALALLLAGFAAGALAGRAWRGREPAGAGFHERREGGNRFVNPLLECDLADEVLRNRELVPFRALVADHLAERTGRVPGATVSVYFRDPDGARIELIADPLGEMYGDKVL